MIDHTEPITQPMTENNKGETTHPIDYESLFGYDRTLHLIIHAILGSDKGELHSVALPDGSTAAVLVTDLFSAFAGKASFEPQIYEPLLDKTKRHTVLLLPDDDWVALAKSYHGFGFVPRKDLRFNFDEQNLDLDHLRTLQKSSMERFEGEKYDTRLIQPADNEHISEYIFGHFETFLSMEELCASPLVHVVIDRETSQVVSVSGAAHTPVNNHYEIQIVTEPEHRRRGLSMAVTTTHMIAAMEAGYVPHWHAASPTSASIAEKLGYGDRIPYTVYFWTTPFIQLLRKSRIPKAIVWVLRKLGKIKD